MFEVLYFIGIFTIGAVGAFTPFIKISYGVLMAGVFVAILLSLAKMNGK